MLMHGGRRLVTFNFMTGRRGCTRAVSVAASKLIYFSTTSPPKETCSLLTSKILEFPQRRSAGPHAIPLVLFHSVPVRSWIIQYGYHASMPGLFSLILFLLPEVCAALSYFHCWIANSVRIEYQTVRFESLFFCRDSAKFNITDIWARVSNSLMLH
jgi:hypothetical protein